MPKAAKSRICMKSMAAMMVGEEVEKGSGVSHRDICGHDRRIIHSQDRAVRRQEPPSQATVLQRESQYLSRLPNLNHSG